MNDCGCHPPATSPDYAEALARTLEGIEASPSEAVALASSSGRILRESILVDRDLPPCDRSRMDGYALRAADLGKGARLPVVGEISAGDDATIDVPEGTCVKIATGAPLPPMLDAVIEHERSDLGDPVAFELDAIEPGRSVHRRASDAHQGATLLEPGIRLRPHHLGLAATVGCTKPKVAPRVKVTVISSGDELVPCEEVPLEHQIRDGNAPMITAVLHAMGAEMISQRHLPDDPAPTRKALAEALESSDLVVTIGGISAGERDFIRPTFEELGISWRLAGARIKPGKPVHVGHTREQTQVVCLPGNPVSALVCAHLFCRPLLARLTGRTDDPVWESRYLAAEVAVDRDRRCFRPAQLRQDGYVTVPSWQGSGDLAHLAECTGLIELAPAEENASTESALRYLDWRTV